MMDMGGGWGDISPFVRVIVSFGITMMVSMAEKGYLRIRITIVE